MSKPIIIDGVNVAECEFWNGSELSYCNIGLWANDGTHICECEKDCYFKQIQRLKAKNKQLRQLYEEEKAKNVIIRQIYKDVHCELLQLINDIEDIVRQKENIGNSLADRIAAKIDERKKL